MEVESEYNKWIKNLDDRELLKELYSIKDNKTEKYERFYKSLEFGTAGIRALMGAGTSRMNIYTVKKVSQGFSNHIAWKSDNPSVAISYDPRNNSEVFAKVSAEVFAGNGIKVYIAKEISPTPFLSFAVRQLKCTAGIMITASHNSKEYNGYKCYSADGAQVGERESLEIYSQIARIDLFNDVKSLDFSDGLKQGLISYIDKNIYEQYLKCVVNQRAKKISLSNLNIVYTPLNGCGSQLTYKALTRIGVTNLKVVKQQEFPDGNFTTCPNPNPERFEAFNLALEDAKKYNSDLVLAADPDSDRLGVCVKHRGNYKMLTGNQIGILLFYYLVKNKKPYLNCLSKPVVIKTLVSSKMVDAIAAKEGCEVKNVFTGFKNIAEQILNLEKNGELNRYLFGFEESNGYLCGTYTRDKDAVSAAVLISEAAAYFKMKNLTFIDVLDRLSKKYGYHIEKNLSFEFKGSDGNKRILNVISKFFQMDGKIIGGLKVLELKNYSNLNMLSLSFEGGNEIIIRPSGTEPKLKVYIMLSGSESESLKVKFENLSMDIKNIVSEL